jgi:hypothetical protein
MARAFVRWQHAAGPYWPYVCSAPFLGQPELPLRKRPPREVEPALLRVLEGAQLPERVAVFVDLPVAGSLPAAAALRRRGFAVVPVIQRWAAPNAVLPCRRLLEDLVTAAPDAGRSHGGAGVIFLLDGDRGGSPEVAPRFSPSLFDNRYSYPVCRFPPPTALERDGIIAVYWLSSEGIAADLLPYAEQLAGAGLAPRTACVSPPPVV